MNKIEKWLIILTTLVLVISVSACGRNDDDGAAIKKSGHYANDMFISADDLTVVADIAGDLFAAAGELTIDSSVLGEVFIAGGDVSIGKKIGGSLIGAGGEINITGDIGDGMLVAGGDIRLQKANIAANTYLVGGSVNIDNDTRIDGKLMVAGGKLFLSGKISRDIRAAGGEITIGGEIDGDVKIMARRINLLPGTKIGGSLIYHAPEKIQITDTVTIGKDINFIQTSVEDHGDKFFFVAGFTHLMLLAGLILLATCAIYVAPALLPAFNKRFHSQALKAFLIGLAVIVFGPIISIILIASVFGMLLALGLLAFYILLTMSGYISAAFTLGAAVLSFLGKPVAGSKLSQLGAITVGILLMGLVLLIPVVGFLVFLVAISIGVGSVLLQLLFFRRAQLIRQI